MMGEDSALMIAMDTKTRTEILEERFDRHLRETKDEMRALGSKFDDLKDLITGLRVDFSDKVKAVQIEHLKDDKDTNLNMYKLILKNGATGAASGGVIAGLITWLMKLKGN